MKIYGAGSFDNERADLTGKSYVNLCFNQIEKSLEWLEIGDICQTLIADLEVLLVLAKLFTDDVFTRLKKSDLNTWQEKYNFWYQENYEKLPKKHRDDMKKNSDKVFSLLQEYSNDISWL